eukprot:753692-Amphidinium_carterae.1
MQTNSITLEAFDRTPVLRSAAKLTLGCCTSVLRKQRIMGTKTCGCFGWASTLEAMHASLRAPSITAEGISNQFPPGPSCQWWSLRSPWTAEKKRVREAEGASPAVEASCSTWGHAGAQECQGRALATPPSAC